MISCLWFSNLLCVLLSIFFHCPSLVIASDTPFVRRGYQCLWKSKWLTQKNWVLVSLFGRFISFVANNLSRSVWMPFWTTLWRNPSMSVLKNWNCVRSIYIPRFPIWQEHRLAVFYVILLSLVLSELSRQITLGVHFPKFGFSREGPRCFN